MRQSEIISLAMSATVVSVTAWTMAIGVRKALGSSGGSVAVAFRASGIHLVIADRCGTLHAA